MTDRDQKNEPEKEIIIGRIVAVDFSGDRTRVTFECERRGPWKSQLAALVIENTSDTK